MTGPDWLLVLLVIALVTTGLCAVALGLPLLWIVTVLLLVATVARAIGRW